MLFQVPAAEPVPRGALSTDVRFLVSCSLYPFCFIRDEPFGDLEVGRLTVDCVFYRASMWQIDPNHIGTWGLVIRLVLPRCYPNSTTETRLLVLNKCSKNLVRPVNVLRRGRLEVGRGCVGWRVDVFRFLGSRLAVVVFFVTKTPAARERGEGGLDDRKGGAGLR